MSTQPVQPATEERDGRIYFAPSSSVPMVPYLLAVDDYAREGDDYLHTSLMGMVGANYCGPVKDALTDEAQRLIVDVGSGSGKWVVDMANEFPHAHVIGIDLLPAERNDIPNNAEFKVADFNQRWPFENNSVDLVHMRQLQYGYGQAPDYSRVLAEATRVLRSGGLLLSGETSRQYVHNEDTAVSIVEYLPKSRVFREAMEQHLRDDGFTWAGESLPIMMSQMPSLGPMQSVVIAFPVGKCEQPEDEPRPLTQIAYNMMNRTIDILSCYRPRYKAGGGTDDDWDSLIIDVEGELANRPHVTLSFYMAWAIKEYRLRSQMSLSRCLNATVTAGRKEELDSGLHRTVTPGLFMSSSISAESSQDILYHTYAGETQLPYVIALVETELSEPYVVYTYRYFLHQWPHLSFLAFPAGRSEPVGCIVCKLDDHRGRSRGYIAMLSVARAWRKRGIARSLVQKVIDRMILSGAEEVVLETEYDNAPALALYGALGFIREKRLFRFYLNGKDAFRLVLPLDVPRLSELPLELEQGASNVDIEDEGVWTDDSE